MNAGLGGEGRRPDIRRVPVRRAVEHFVEGARKVRDLAQSVRRHAGLETLRELRLQGQCGDECDEVGVAAALAETIQRALHLPHAGADGGERIGDRVAGVVVRVDAEIFARNDARDLADDAFDLVRQRSAVGVAQHRPARAGLDRGAGAGERVFWVGLVAVEEMFAIDHRLAAGGDRRLHAVGDGFEVLVERAAQRDMDVIVPRLGDIDDRVGVGGEKTREARIIGGRAARTLGHAEGAEAGAAGGLLFEEFGVERVRARIAALDIVDAEPVEHRRDAALVVEREVDAGGQRAVAHRGVEQVEAFFWPWDSSSMSRWRRRIAGQSVLAIVVLASHWSPTRTRLRFCAVKPWRSNSGLADIAGVVSQALRAARLREPRQRLDQRSGRRPGERIRDRRTACRSRRRL